MHYYYVREEQLYEGSAVPIVYGSEVEVGNNPQQSNTIRSCAGVLVTSTRKMTITAVGEGVASQLNSSPICFFSARVFLPPPPP